MRVVIKMSVNHGSRNYGDWGLVRKVGPWKPTARDKVGAGYKNDNEMIRPGKVVGNKPPPTLSKWAQRSVVSMKPYDVGLRKQRPGIQHTTNGILKGINQTLQGLGSRIGGVNIGQQTSTNPRGEGNDGGDGDPDFQFPGFDPQNPRLLGESTDSSSDSEYDYGGGQRRGSNLFEPVNYPYLSRGVVRGMSNLGGHVATAAGGYLARDVVENLISSRALLENTLHAMGAASLVQLLRYSLDAREEFYRILRDYSTNPAAELISYSLLGTGGGRIGDSVTGTIERSARVGYSLVRAVLDFLTVSGSTLSLGGAMSRGAGAIAPTMMNFGGAIAQLGPGGARMRQRRYNLRN